MNRNEQVTRTFIAARMADRGMRLDRFLQAALAPLSRKQVKRLIDAGHVRLAGKPVRRAGRLIAGDEVFSVAGVPGPVVPEGLSSSRVLYEDAHLVVLDKPAGLRMHAVEAGDRQHLVAYLEQALGPDPVHVVSRLDKETSGVVVVARTSQAAEALTESFRHHSVSKVYRAVVHGCPSRREGTIDAPIGPVGQGRYGIRSRGRSARTSYRVVRCMQNGAGENGTAQARSRKGEVVIAGEDFAVVELEPETGRTHQLRVHLAGIGHPIVGDLWYGGRRVPGVLRTLLHAESLEIPHPATGERMAFTAPLPEDMAPWVRVAGS